MTNRINALRQMQWDRIHHPQRRSLPNNMPLPYQRAAGAKYEMVSMTYDPGFDESRTPAFFTQVFEREGIPFLCLR